MGEPPRTITSHSQLLVLCKEGLGETGAKQVLSVMILLFIGPYFISSSISDWTLNVKEWGGDAVKFF